MRARLAQSPSLTGRANKFFAALHCAKIGGSGVVASASAWEKAGRPVMEDADGFPIWVARQVSAKRDDEPEAESADTPEEAAGAGTRTVFSFGGRQGTAKYYDISETEGEETSTDRWGRLAANVAGDSAENDEAYRDAMQQAAESFGLRVTHIDESKMKGSGHLAGLSWATKEIYVRAGLSPAAEAASVAHELGHYLDPFLAKFQNDAPALMEAYSANRDSCEFVAESVSYAVSSAWGVDTSQVSAEYLHNWRPERARQAKNLVERGEAAMDKLLAAANADKHDEWAQAA